MLSLSLFQIFPHFSSLPSATTDVESSIFPDLPSATTDVESSIFPDLPSATTDVETSTSTVIPSATTSTEASTLPTPNPNGIGLGGLDPLPDSIKELLEKYEKKKQSRDEQKKKCELLRFQYDDQKKHATDLKIRLYLLEHISQGNGDGPKYDDEIQVNESNLEAQESKLNDLKKRLKGCDSKYNGIVFGLKVIEVKLVKLVFGRPWDPKSFDQQLLLIGTYPSIQGYFGGSGNKGQSSGRSKRPSQKPSDQQSQESQPSPDTPSGSGSPGQKVPSNRQKGSSKLMNGLKSFFGRPK
ncbi:hypothetical protein QVD99_006409 [Batrachochytrium dendrobatidis]|nr:hypothetical protein QVD99_006409 [Batrachochytrium dendrobatidis]